MIFTLFCIINIKSKANFKAKQRLKLNHYKLKIVFLLHI